MRHLKLVNVLPPLAMVVLVLTWGSKPPVVVLVLVGVLIAASVIAAVHHAEVIALRVGEPFGSIVLAVAVTVIEVGLIVTLMVGDSAGNATLARDTVFAAVMISCNGILGLCVLVGALRTASPRSTPRAPPPRSPPSPRSPCSRSSLPTFTTSAPGPEFTGAQFAFAAVASVTLYALFVFVQTVRHRDYFCRRRRGARAPPSDRDALVSLALLTAGLVAVVGLAKVESQAIEDAITGLGAPKSAVGVIIALLVLLPETLAAVRNAARDRVQTSFNLALGSSIASIGLTIPAIAIASIWLDGPLILGLDATQLVLLTITVLVGSLTVLPGRATCRKAACTSYCSPPSCSSR